MKTVPREPIIEAWDRLCDLNKKQSTELSRRFTEGQPAVSVYLLAWTEEIGPEATQSPLIELAMLVWKVMTSTAGKPLPEIVPEALERAEKANTEMLENLSEGSEFEMHVSDAGLITSFNQSELLGFCIEVLMQDDSDQPELAPERIGMELLVLKTIIDCFDQ